MQDAAAPKILVGGTVRRVAVVTIRRNSCALYLARRLAETGADVWLVNQTRMRLETDSRAFFRRFREKYGAMFAFDYFLLFLVKAIARAPRRLLGRDASAAAPAGLPIAHESSDPSPNDTFRTIEIDDINRGPGHDAFKELKADLVLLAGAPVLSKATIALAAVACINPHCGITPRYCGGSPFDWAIYERRFGDVGYTIHLVVPTVDAGPILVQQRVSWDPHKPNGHLWPILAQAMYDRLAGVARELIGGATLTARPQGAARVLPTMGLFARTLSEMRRRAYARTGGTGLTD